MRNRTLRNLTVVLSVAALFTACSADDVAAQRLAILATAADTGEIPATVATDVALAAESARFLGDHNGRSYFVARSATAPEHNACLVEFMVETDEVSSACSDVVPGHADRIVTLGSTGVGSELSLVSDEADSGALEDDGWTQVTEHLWARDQ